LASAITTQRILLESYFNLWDMRKEIARRKAISFLTQR
jgi:hypothetical protein